MENLDEALCDRMVGFLGPQDAASLSCVSTLFKKRVNESNWWKIWCQSEFPSLRMQPACSILETGLETGTSTRTYKGLYRDLVTSCSADKSSLFNLLKKSMWGEYVALLDVRVAGRHFMSQCIEKGIKCYKPDFWSLECRGNYEVEALKCLVLGAAYVKTLASRSGACNHISAYSETSFLETISLKFLHREDGTLQKWSIKASYVHPLAIEYVVPQYLSGHEGQRRLEEGFLFIDSANDSRETLEITGSCIQSRDDHNDMGAGTLGVRALHKKTFREAVCTNFQIEFTAGAKFDGSFLFY